MSLGYTNNPHKTADLLVDPRGQKTLALVIALILSAGAFLLAAGEAQAEQKATVVEQHMSVPSSVPSPVQVSEPSSVGGTPAAETSFPQMSLPDSRTLTSQPELAPAPEPKLRADKLSAMPLPNDTTIIGDRLDPKPVMGKPTPPIASGARSDPESKDQGAPGDRPVSALGEHVDTMPALKQRVGLVEDNELALPLTESKLSASPKKPFAASDDWPQQPPQMSPATGHIAVTTAGGAGHPAIVETPPVQIPVEVSAEMPVVDRAPLVATPATATAAPVEWAPSVSKPYTEKPVVSEPAALTAVLTPPLIDMGGASRSSATLRAPLPMVASVGSMVQIPQDAADATANMVPVFTGGASSTGSPSRTEEPSQGAPPHPPSAPSTPLDSGSLALSGSGQAGGSGGGEGIAPLFVFVLATGLLLSRREDGLLSLVCWSFPKPSSALLMPLERPG